jgi:hypothetical protein
MTRKTPSQRREVVTLADLAPRQRVTGGSERRVFGADPLVRAKDLNADMPSATDVKDGKKAAAGRGQQDF